MQTLQPSRGEKKSLWIILAALFLMAAGVVHLVAVPGHWDHGLAHGLILGFTGLLEILWGLAFLYRPSVALFRSGLILAVVLITVWAITRWLPAPFGHNGPGGIDAAGVISKLCEGLAATALVALAVSGFYYSRSASRVAWRAVGVLVATAIVAGWASYGVARAVEPLIPSARHDHAVPGDLHHHEDESHHHEDESPHRPEGEAVPQYHIH